MKIVLNKCYGGFSISRECAELMAQMGNKQAIDELAEWRQNNGWVQYYLANHEWPDDCPQDKQRSLEIDAKYRKESKFYGFGYTNNGGGYERHSKELVSAVEQLGSKKASGELSELKVVEIPDGVEYEIDDYDGIESIHEAHRSWG